MHLFKSKNPYRAPWNKGKIIGQRPPFKLKHVWAIRTTLQINKRVRDLALFNLAIDSQLRGCDVVSLTVDDVVSGGRTKDRATVLQKKTGRPVTFEITEQARHTVDEYVRLKNRNSGGFLFKGHFRNDNHLSTRQYSRLVWEWAEMIGLVPGMYGTHSIRRTNATLIYRKTGNIWAVQLLLGRSKVESTVRYLGIEMDDAIAIAKQVDI